MGRFWGVVAAAMFGLSIGGCAVGIEDPQPPPAPEPEQRQTPSQTFSAPLIGDRFHGAAEGSFDEAIRNLPPKQKPPVPGLNVGPEPESAP